MKWLRSLSFLDMADPRGGKAELIAFYFPGRDTEPWVERGGGMRL